jgi:hypothetical protein
MFQADPRGILTLVAIALCWALALLLFRTGTPGSVARKLSLLLVVEGVTLGTSFSTIYLFTSHDQFYALHASAGGVMEFAHYFGDSLMLALYPGFLAATLQTPLVRPFKGNRTYVVMAVLSIAFFIAVLTTPPQVGILVLSFVLTMLFSFSLVASIHAWHVATGMARTRAGIFALAFGIRDVCWGVVYAGVVWEMHTGNLLNETFVQDFNIYAVGTLFAIPLIAYGILRTQLFDIDLKIRWTIKQSTLAGVFVAIMYIVSEGASNLLEAELGNVAGLLAAAVVMFFLAPLQRFAERVATVAMPNTQNTPEYASFRKMQVYEAALAEALLEGGISEKERTLLVHLRDSLGISEFDAEAIEEELQSQPAS